MSDIETGFIVGISGIMVGILCAIPLLEWQLTKDCADEAVSDEPRDWWKKAIYAAQLRKDGEK